MHTSSCDSMLSSHRWRSVCDVSHERYCQILAIEYLVAKDIITYPMFAFGED